MLKPSIDRRAMIRRLGNQLRVSVPFPVDHNRNEASDYEHYRQRALTWLISHGLSSTRAACIVDDCIAVVENRLHGRANASLDA